MNRSFAILMTHSIQQFEDELQILEVGVQIQK